MSRIHHDGRTLCRSLLPLAWIVWVSYSTWALCTELNTHLAQESERLKEDLGEGGAGTGLVADLCQHDAPADKW